MSVAFGVTPPARIIDSHHDTPDNDLRVEVLQQEVLNLEAQLDELEQKSARSSRILRAFGRQFGFAAVGKLDWMRFKLNYMRKELVRVAADAAPGSQ